MSVTDELDKQFPDLEPQAQVPDEDRALSILGDLRRRREEIVAEQLLPLTVPRWKDPKIVVHYRAVEHDLIRNVINRVERASDKDKARVEVEANTDVLIRACAKVVAILDGHEYSLRPGDPHGAPTLFDEDLAENLGLTEKLNRRPTAREVVKELYLTEGDIISAAGSISDFSGYRDAEADDTLVGES